jgi:hypothetical protein
MRRRVMIMPRQGGTAFFCFFEKVLKKAFFESNSRRAGKHTDMIAVASVELHEQPVDFGRHFIPESLTPLKGLVA